MRFYRRLYRPILPAKTVGSRNFRIMLPVFTLHIGASSAWHTSSDDCSLSGVSPTIVAAAGTSPHHCGLRPE